LHCAAEAPRPDSRVGQGLRAAIAIVDGEGRPLDGVAVAPAASLELAVHVRNTGAADWLPAETGIGGVQVGLHLLTARAGVRESEYGRAPLPPATVIPPGAETTARVTVTAPATAGTYVLEVDLVAEGVAWFAMGDSQAARVTLDVA